MFVLRRNSGSEYLAKSGVSTFLHCAKVFPSQAAAERARFRCDVPSNWVAVDLAAEDRRLRALRAQNA